MAKLRIPKHLLNLDELKDIFYCSSIKETKNYWQLDKVTIAEITLWLLMSNPDTTGVKIERRYSEYLPEFETF